MSDSKIEQWCADAMKLGVDHAHNAADWAYDGNSDRAERGRVLDMMREGDPAAYDYLPQEPNLSGEWADGMTPHSLADDVGLPINDCREGWLDAICDAYEQGVSETFGPACEAALVEFVR